MPFAACHRHNVAADIARAASDKNLSPLSIPVFGAVTMPWPEGGHVVDAINHIGEIWADMLAIPDCTASPGQDMALR
jgi:hypothetical protein